MPYIPIKQRLAAEKFGAELPQELAYLVFLAAREQRTPTDIRKLVDAYLRANGKRFYVMNEIIGVLITQACELTRRGLPGAAGLTEVAAHFQKEVIDPYEQRKLEENGDVKTGQEEAA